MNIVLVGYRGSGKTETGKRLSRLLDWPFVDTDRMIEQVAAKTIRQIFHEDGEPRFRELETAVIDQAFQGDQQVVALGGGAVLRPVNRIRVQQNSVVVWLQADPATLYQRIQADSGSPATRPNLTSLGGQEEVAKLLADREPAYRDACDWEINSADRTPQQIAQEISDRLASGSTSDDGGEV